MASRKSRRLAIRRDRRKAKASGWRRQGRGNMSGNKIGHGGAGQTQNATRIVAGGLEPMPKREVAGLRRVVGSASPSQNPVMVQWQKDLETLRQKLVQEAK